MNLEIDNFKTGKTRLTKCKSIMNGIEIEMELPLDVYSAGLFDLINLVFDLKKKRSKFFTSSFEKINIDHQLNILKNGLNEINIEFVK